MEEQLSNFKYVMYWRFSGYWLENFVKKIVKPQKSSRLWIRWDFERRNVTQYVDLKHREEEKQYVDGSISDS